MGVRYISALPESYIFISRMARGVDSVNRHLADGVSSHDAALGARAQ